MSEPVDTVRLLSGIVSHMRQIVGDGACYAMLHYGAVEEGKRFGAACPQGNLPEILSHIDRAMGQHSEVVADTGSRVVVRVRSSALAETGQRPIHGVILGLVEGGVTSARKARYKGSILPAKDGDELIIELLKDV